MPLVSLKTRARNAKPAAIGIAIAIVGLSAWFGSRLSTAMATPPAPSAPAAPATPAVPAAPAAPAPPAAPAAPSAPTAPGSTGTGGGSGSGGSTAAATATPTTTQIVFMTMPPARATVTWGKVLLGRIAPGQPLVIVRPRDSGPLDVTVKAPGYLSVHTRAHTFADSKVAVKLTTPDEKSTLFGYRAPLPDAGMPTDEAVAPPLTGVDIMQQPPL